MKENAFIANHSHFWFLVKKRYWTVGMGVRRFIARIHNSNVRQSNATDFYLTATFIFGVLKLIFISCREKRNTNDK